MAGKLESWSGIVEGQEDTSSVTITTGADGRMAGLLFFWDETERRTRYFEVRSTSAPAAAQAQPPRPIITQLQST